MGGRGGGSPGKRGGNEASAGQSRTTQAEAQIRAYVLANQQETGWVTMANLRNALSGFTRGEQDSALRNMDNDDSVRIMHWDNRKSLSPRDHEAALPLAGTTMDVIRILR